MKAVITLILTFAFAASSAQAQSLNNSTASNSTYKQQADTLMRIGVKHFFRRNFDSALNYLYKGLAFAQKTGQQQLLADYYLTLGNVHTNHHQLEEALSNLRTAKNYLTPSVAQEFHLKYFVLTALVFEDMHHTDSALHYLHKAEEYNNATNPYKNWVVYNIIGGMFQDSEEYEKSDEYFNKAYTITKAKGIRVDHGMVIFRYATMVFQWGKASRFAWLMEERERFAKGSKIDATIDPTHQVMFADWSSKSFAEGVSFLELVKADFVKRGMNINITVANQYLAQLYEKEKDYKKAMSYLDENKTLLTKEPDVTRHYANTALRYRLLKKMDQNAEANSEADKLLFLKDSMVRMQKREAVVELETKYESEKKERELSLLNAENNLNSLRLTKETDLKLALQRENELKDSVVSREKEYNVLLASDNSLRKTQLQNESVLKAAVTSESRLRGEQLVKEKKLRVQLLLTAGLLLLSGAVIFVLYRRQRNKNRLIQKQSDELQTLMKEIHHRVKNNLQIISSLLDLQSISIRDKEASEAVKEGKNRVLSMALIHQNLYSEGNIKGIKVKDYIQNLAGSLFDSYNIQKEKIKLVTDIEPLNLDVDTVIPIGLIINELLSNSLKYAFAGRDSGEIKVTLKQHTKELQLQIRDNGIGFSPDWTKNSTSFGYKLINAFTQKLKAKLDVYNDGGACVNMTIQKYKLAG